MQKKEILFVDDNAINREALFKILREKYSVLQAENGAEALELLKKKEGISLILLDVTMPVTNGYAFLDKLMEDKELSLIPVIVLTQSGGEEDEVAALTHGATDFVPKPYRPQVMLHRVENIIKLRETAAMVNQLRYDRLTGIYNKEYFFEKVQDKLQENPDKEYCIVCSNIENFKLFNDVYGVDAGDELLKDVARIMLDMVGKGGVCGRFSADRFVCLQEKEREKTDRSNFGKFHAKITPDMKKVTMRWGIYDVTDRSVSVEKMCDRAMLAVNSIKGTYNQYFAVYDDVLRGKLLREKAITDAMETALAENQFVVYFQPKYSLSDDSMAGAEALVRWIHPVWGIVPPNDFIPLFEKNGFISRLDKFVWERSCAFLRGRKEKGKTIVPVSVNVSRVDIYRLNLEEVFPALMEKYGLDPSYLHLEITEGACSENQEEIIATVNNLRKLGFDIEMDDFGSGYSSLSMISKMKLDALKLDMKFVRNETAKPFDHSILSDVVNMAHRLNLRVVAEGVETRGQIRRLQAVGCDYAQGYFFSKPLPAGEFERLLDVQRKKEVVSRVTHPSQDIEIYSVLIADEDDGFREKVSRAFEGEFNAIQVSDAQSATDAVNRYGEGIAAVILSMTLPDDGAEKTMRFLRRESGFWRIPVLATVPTSENKKAMTLALEADDFLCKRHPVFDLRKKAQRLADEAVMHRQMNFLLNQAHHDYTTGLLNRRGLDAAMETLRRENGTFALCIFDLDNLKSVNDTYGHEEGDRMIEAFTNLLKRNIRSDDIAGRYGGDEFVVIFRGTDEETAVKRVNEICEKCRACVIAQNIPMSCSGGIAVCEQGDAPSVAYIERADEALYRAKRENKGFCCVWKRQA